MRWALLALLAAACGHDGGVTVYNTPPSVSITTPADGSSYDEGETITFEALVSDDFDAPETLSITWSSDIDGTFEGDFTPEQGVSRFVTANLSPGNHTVTVKVVDSGGEAASDLVQVTVNDLPEAPEIAVVHPAGSESGAEGVAFTFVASVSDARDAPEDLAVTFESDLDGLFCEPVPDAAGLAECDAVLSPGDHLLTYTATNTNGYTASATAYFAVIPASEIDDDGDGWTEEQGDCDDTDPTVNPGGTEIENGVDDDCDGTVDEGTAAWDDDGDGWSENEGDCDDTDPAVSPGGTEVCDNGVDDDCDGVSNEEDAEGCTDYYLDFDGDTYGSDSDPPRCLCAPDGDYTSVYGTDCYDLNASANPGQTSYFSVDRGDGSFDWNCDGRETKRYTDEYDCPSLSFSCSTGWRSGVPACGVSATYVTSCTNYFLTCEISTTTRTQECR